MSNVENLEGADVHGWKLTRALGCGADGVVYAGEKDGFEAAVKLFFPESLAKNGWSQARERLELQLALIGRKHHPNLVEVYAGGEAPEFGTLYLVMELVPGKSLDKLVASGLPRSAIPNLAAQLASAAQYLETIDLVHRDIKPANIVVSDDFSKLTLLDLGIIHHAAEDEQGRLSGLEFVATLRYSPHEFVWRTEDADAEGAWRAVTFYQIGATLHDMIMQKILFTGHDTPRACLYDAVRDLTPIIEAPDVPGWLLQTTQACLLKDWRQRLQFIDWTAFKEPEAVDPQQQERRIRLMQIRREEVSKAATRRASPSPVPTREQQLWMLNNALVTELRTYLQNAAIFPKFHVAEEAAPHAYTTRFHFDKDPSRGFVTDAIFIVTLSADSTLEDATRLEFDATSNGKAITTAAWSELFNVETAFHACRQVSLDAVERIISGEEE